MANLLPRLVPVARITGVLAQPGDFPPYTIDRLAKAIVQAGALAVPLLVTPDGVGWWRLVSDDLRYWAAVRAHALDPVGCEHVQAYIAEGDQLMALAAQLPVPDVATNLRTIARLAR